MGIGGELSWTHEQSQDDAYNFKRLDTIFFTPTEEYIKASMKEKDVSDWVEGSNFEPVYMVTGLKIAHGPSVKLNTTKKWDLAAQAGVQNPAGLPLQVGPKLHPSGKQTQESAWEDSDDFIFGIRVKRLVYKKFWFSRSASRKFEVSAYNKGATLVDDDDQDSGDDDVLDIALDKELEGMETMLEIDAGIETTWIVPKPAQT
ncbi:MAG: hypothetical protein M1822_002806 [Bathelium mastoideum]|nr:MAG: hypothetical protein M1822_002806 [Bathelium mastoideum]